MSSLNRLMGVDGTMGSGDLVGESRSLGGSLSGRLCLISASSCYSSTLLSVTFTLCIHSLVSSSIGPVRRFTFHPVSIDFVLRRPVATAMLYPLLTEILIFLSLRFLHQLGKASLFVVLCGGGYVKQKF